MASKQAVFGLATSEQQAEAIVTKLQRSGFSKDDISALFPDKTKSRDFAHEQHTKAPEGAITGAAAGGVFGGTLGLLAGIGALAIPGLGPFIAAGPIMAALSGAAVGATAGGITGALVGMGIPELEAKQYEAKIKDGNILISVHVGDAEARGLAKKVLEQGGATHIVTGGEKGVPSKEKHPSERKL
jgi:hypothetical protein